MANFLRSFGLGFVRSANVQFDEKRKLQAAKDLEYSKLAGSAFATYNTSSKASAAKTKQNLADSRAVLTPQIIGSTPGGNLAAAMIFNGLLDPKQATSFLQNMPDAAKQRLAANPFEFTPGQTGIPDITTALKNAGVPDKNIQEFFKSRNIDPGDFLGQPAIASSLDKGPPGFGVSETLPSQADQRIEKLATSFVDKPNMFTSDRDFKQAQIAFKDGDFETVLDLTARSPTLQNSIFLPIIEQVLESGPESLSKNQIFVLDLYKPRDPLDQMVNLLILQNREAFEKVISDGIEQGLFGEPPGEDATEEDRMSWLEEKIGELLALANKYYEETLRGRKPE